MKRIIMLVLCICISASMLFAEEPAPTQGTLMIRCVFSGKAWVNNECVEKSKAPPVTTPAASPPVGCNPLLCMINHKGKCVNNVCVENMLSATPTPTSTPTAMPRH